MSYSRSDLSQSSSYRDADFTRFPRMRARLPSGRYRDLGASALVLQLRLTDEQTFGKWCTPCEGIWFGNPLEVQCPVCGNRNG